MKRIQQNSIRPAIRHAVHTDRRISNVDDVLCTLLINRQQHQYQGQTQRQHQRQRRRDSRRNDVLDQHLDLPPTWIRRSRRGDHKAPRSCTVGDTCASVLDNFCSGSVQIASSSCGSSCDKSTQSCECDASATCDGYGQSKDGGNTNCDEDCRNVASCPCDTSCECDTAATSCGCDVAPSSCGCDDCTPFPGGFGCLRRDRSCVCDSPGQSCDCDTAATSCPCDDSCACDATVKCHTSCEKDESCEADESCPCDVVPALRGIGGDDCDAQCTGCNLDLCTCCSGLKKRSQTLCCPPKPRNSEWSTALALSDTSTKGSCAWRCTPPYDARPRDIDAVPLTFASTTTTLFGWAPEECCAKPEHSFWTTDVGCSWHCDIKAGYTRGGEYTTNHVDQGGWDCAVCRPCSEGTYQTAACSETSHPQCAACTECDKAGGLFNSGGCTGEQDTVCLPRLSRSSLQGLAVNFSSTITLETTAFPIGSLVAGGACDGVDLASSKAELVQILNACLAGSQGGDATTLAITIRPVADEGTIKFDPPSVTIDGWQLAVGGEATLEEAAFGLELSTTIVMTPLKIGIANIRYEISGFLDCGCRPSPVGEPCQRGCPGGSGVIALPAEKVLIYNADHTTVFERLGQ